MWKPQGLYADFILRQPTLFFGKDAINGLAAMPGAKISVIHGESLDESVKDTLKRIFKKKAVYFNKKSWEGEPDLTSLGGTIQMLESQQPDVIIAIGGGAIIDGAKMCRLFYEYPAFDPEKNRINQLEFATRFVAIPTTVGSGAECSSAAVYINTEARKKEMLVSHDFLPVAVVLDPAYVSGAPMRLVAASGLDAMAHIIEGYVSNIDNAICDVLAETGLRLLVREFCKDGSYDFEKLQYAGYLGGIVQNHCIVGAAHGVAHQLSADGYSHGEAVALLLPAVIKCNSSDSDIAAKYERLFASAGLNGVDGFMNLVDKILCNSGISEKREDLKALLNQNIQSSIFIDNVANDQGAKGNPVEINEEYLRALIGEI